MAFKIARRAAWVIFLAAVCIGPLMAQDDSASDYGDTPQLNQPGDAQLRCGQISSQVAQMNALAARSGQGAGSQHSGGGLGRALGGQITSSVRGHLSAIGGGIFGDLANPAASQSAQSDEQESQDTTIGQAALARRAR